MATPQRPRTSPGRGEPRHLILPDGIKSSSWPSVRETLRVIGIEFDPWQADVSRVAHAKDSSGLWAADAFVFSICRQAGKTFMVGGWAFARAITTPGATIIWTAHRFKVARETFNSLRGMATTSLMAPHVDPDAITTAAGNECINFRNGSRIVFAARERGAIRGFSKVSMLVLDEAQILTEAAMTDLTPTMNAAENPQMVLMGTPPRPQDPSETFTNYRAEALAGRNERSAYVEFSADPDGDPDDREQWAVANPSYPHRTTARAFQRMRRAFASEDDFSREALGRWDEDGAHRVIPDTAWRAARDESSRILTGLTLAVDVSPSRTSGAVVAAGRTASGRVHFEVLEVFAQDAVDEDQQVHAIPGFLARAVERNEVVGVIVDERSPASSMLEEMKALGVRATTTSHRDYVDACARFYDGLVAGELAHIGQPQMDEALAGAGKRETDAGWLWSRKSSRSDITPLVAASLAVWGVKTNKKVKAASVKPGRTSSRRAVVL